MVSGIVPTVLKALTSEIIGLCIPIYSLFCVRDEIRKSQPKKKSFHDPEDIPYLDCTFSHVKRTRAIDFDILFANFSRNCQAILFSKLLEQCKETNIINKLIVICRRIPWTLNLTNEISLFR